MKTRKLLLVLLLTLMQGSVYAQMTNQQSTIDKLMSTKWYPVGFASVTEFALEVRTSTPNDNPERVTIMRYYLSDKIDATFNEKMVGKVRDGKYIAYSWKDKNNHEHFRVFEIIKLNKREMQIQQVEIRDGTIIRGGLPYVYKEVK